jgi:hypothetical protein
VDEAAVRAHLALDKKHAAGRLRWVLPTESGVVVRSDVPDEAVAAGIVAALGGAAGDGFGAGRAAVDGVSKPAGSAVDGPERETPAVAPDEERGPRHAPRASVEAVR